MNLKKVKNYMNIWAGNGDIVRYVHEDAGTERDKKNCAQYLELGKEYIVHRVIVHRQHTEVELEGIYCDDRKHQYDNRNYRHVKFNSVNFEDVEIDERAADARKYLYGKEERFCL